jgi:hypothetical protein
MSVLFIRYSETGVEQTCKVYIIARYENNVSSCARGDTRRKPSVSAAGHGLTTNHSNRSVAEELLHYDCKSKYLNSFLSSRHP